MTVEENDLEIREDGSLVSISAEREEKKRARQREFKIEREKEEARLVALTKEREKSLKEEMKKLDRASKQRNPGNGAEEEALKVEWDSRLYAY